VQHKPPDAELPNLLHDPWWAPSTHFLRTFNEFTGICCRKTRETSREATGTGRTSIEADGALSLSSTLLDGPYFALRTTGVLTIEIFAVFK
jgi:hypothetical protein